MSQVLLIMISLQLGSAIQGIPSMTVCELLPRLQAFADHTIRLEGLYRWSEEHGGVVGDDCKTHFTFDGFQWPDAVTLTFRADARTPEGYVIKDLLLELQRVAKLASVAGTRRQIVVSVTGKLTSKPRYIVNQDVSGKKLSADGFGAFGQFPAELSVVDVRFVRLLP